MGNASLELDKTMGPRPANSIRDRSLIDGFTKVRMYGCNLILRQPSLRNALQGGSDHVRLHRRAKSDGRPGKTRAGQNRRATRAASSTIRSEPDRQIPSATDAS